MKTTAATQDVLTADETVRFLRLDRQKINNPRASLNRLRRLGLLHGIRIGREYVFARAAVEEFVARQTAAVAGAR